MAGVFRRTMVRREAAHMAGVFQWTMVNWEVHREAAHMAGVCAATFRI